MFGDSAMAAVEEEKTREAASRRVWWQESCATEWWRGLPAAPEQGTEVNTKTSNTQMCR